MSGLATVALILVAIWLGVLTLALVLTVRQIGILTVRLSQAGESFSVDADGPEVGGYHNSTPLSLTATTETHRLRRTRDRSKIGTRARVVTFWVTNGPPQ